MPYDKIPSKATLKPEKFEIKIDQKEVDAFYQLIKLSPLPPKTFENLQRDTAQYGVNYDWMTQAKEYWTNTYDWRKREEYFNSFPNFKVPIDDDDSFEYSIHFAALFSEKEDAVPIVLMHGWPGSFLEFLGLLDIARAKYSSQNLPYHLIVPSLPGYAFSNITTEHDMVVEDISRIMDKLMIGLGFSDGYVGQGGDIGAYTCRPLAQYPSCKAIHLNFCMMSRPQGSNDDELTAQDRKGLARADDFAKKASAYALEHGTRPATIGFVLSSSPIALFAWISEKFIDWTDKTPELEEILDSVSLYWFTQSFPRCIYPYRQFHGVIGAENMAHSYPKFQINRPMGYSYFPYELAPMPKSWVATTGDLRWYREHQAGGHFAAMEKPKELFQDIEDFLVREWEHAKAVKYEKFITKPGVQYAPSYVENS